jgi:hypothetical protein
MPPTCDLCGQALSEYKAATEEYTRALAKMIRSVGTPDYAGAARTAETLHQESELAYGWLHEHYRDHWGALACL